MTTFNTIAANLLLPGEPWTSAKANTVYDNPIAITEGAPGAPRNSPAALARYSIPIDTVFVAPSGILAGGTYFCAIIMNGGGAAGTGQVRYRTSTDGGSNWTSWTSILSLANGSDEALDIASAELTFPAATNAVHFDSEGSQVKKISAIMTVWGS